VTDESAANLSEAIQKLATAIAEVPRTISVNSKCNVEPLGNVLIEIRNELSRIARGLAENK
jgi:hypothetical protein